MNSENGYNCLRSDEYCMIPFTAVESERSKETCLEVKSWKLDGLVAAFETKSQSASEPLHSCSAIQSSGECLLFSNLHLHLRVLHWALLHPKVEYKKKKWGISFFGFRNTSGMNNVLIKLSLADSPKMKQLNRNSRTIKLPQIWTQLMKSMESKKAEGNWNDLKVLTTNKRSRL